MKRFIVCVVLMLFCFAMPTAAPAAPPTCDTCRLACAAAVAAGLPLKCEKICTGLCRP